MLMSTLKFERPEHLSNKVVRGGTWVFLLRMIGRGLGLIRTIILARILSPNDFGLLGIALLAISMLETFTQMGFHSALVQKKENIESYLDTAWTVSAVRGVVLFLIIFFSSPLIAIFFNSPESILIIKTIAISSLITGFRNIGIVYFQKSLEFHKQFIYVLSATLIDLILSVILVFILKNVWALVIGGLAGNFTMLIMSYTLQSYRPHPKFNLSAFKELFDFGRWMLGSSILFFLVNQGDDIFVGKMLGTGKLGLYQMAFLLSNLPTTEIAHIISQVTFPAYSRLQNEMERLKEAYLHVLQLTTFLTALLAFGIFALGPNFVVLFLGEKWTYVIAAFQIMAFSGLLRSIAATTGPVFHGVGMPKIETAWQGARLFILIILLYPLTVKWGILGTSFAVLISIFIATIGFSVQIIKLVQIEARIYIKALIFPIISGLIMALIILFVKSNFRNIGIVEFIFLVVTGIASYLMMMAVFDKVFNCGIFKLIKEKMNIQQAT